MEHFGKKPKNITVAVHQIRSPIYVLREYIEALLSEEPGQINKKQRDYLEASLENIEKTMSVINDFVEFLEMEEQEKELKKEKVDLVSLTKESVENYRMLARASNSRIIFDQPLEKIPPVLTDRKKIKYVIENLLSNAIQYKEKEKEGKVEIEIKDEGEKVLFKIKDNGMGVKEEDKEEIFSRFHRTPEAIRISPTGVGIGLYISKLAVNLSGGDLWFENNKEERGTTFYFTLLKA